MGTKNYEAIAARADQLNLPITFKTDVTDHDRAACRRNPDTRRFIWAIGTTGSNMIWLGMSFSTSGARDLIASFVDNDRAGLHFWDGERLRPIDADDAVQLLTHTP